MITAVNVVESIKNPGIVVDITAPDGGKIRKIILAHRKKDTYLRTE